MTPPQDYLLAVKVCEEVVGQSGELQLELQSAIGRLFLLAGDLASAQHHFSLATAGDGGKVKVQTHLNQ